MKNKLFILTGALFLLVACKTSGDIRAEKMKDPSGIRTVSPETPVPAKSKPKETGAAVQQQDLLEREELARQIEILKGQMSEKDYLHLQEKNQLMLKLQALETEKIRLLEEVAILKGTATPTSVQGADLLWEAAQKDLKAKKYAQAATSLKDFSENFPNDARLEEAHILRGQAEYAAEKFQESLVSFGSYLDKYSKGKGRAVAWLGQGAALIRMKQKKDAKLFLEQCVTLHPKSKEAKLAKRLLKNPNVVPPEIFL